MNSRQSWKENVTGGVFHTDLNHSNSNGCSVFWKFYENCCSVRALCDVPSSFTSLGIYFRIISSDSKSSWARTRTRSGKGFVLAASFLGGILSGICYKLTMCHRYYCNLIDAERYQRQICWRIDSVLLCCYWIYSLDSPFVWYITINHLTRYCITCQNILLLFKNLVTNATRFVKCVWSLLKALSLAITDLCSEIKSSRFDSGC